MKKVLAVLLAVMMVFAIAACTKKDTVTDDKTPENDVQTPVGETGGENTDDEQTSADKTTDNDTLVMATNAYSQPYEYYEGDKIVGIDAEIAEAIAAKLGKTLKIEDMQFDSILTAVQEGSVDFGMAGMTVTEERLESVNFTSSYATGIQSVIVKEDSPITSVDDLFADDAAYKAGVQLGTTGDGYCTGDLGKVLMNIVPAKVAGVDRIVMTTPPGKDGKVNPSTLVAANEGLKILDTSYADEDYAICVAKENTALLDELNKAIDELTADGTIDAIVAKYIK